MIMSDPVAFELGPLVIRWYGIFVAAGFLCGYWLAMARAERHGFNKDDLGTIAFVGMIAGILGARVMYVFHEWDYFRTQPAEIIRIDRGGLVFYGGLIIAVLAVAIYSTRKKYSWGEVGDLLAPSIALGHGFGRIGCFLNGCCFGRVWRGHGGVVYAFDSNVGEVQRAKELLDSAATACEPVFPVQLLAALSAFGLCAFLLTIERKCSRRGQLFSIYVIGYAVIRFCIEFLRGDYTRTIHGITPAQLICLFMIPAGVLMFTIATRRGGRAVIAAER